MAKFTWENLSGKLVFSPEVYLLNMIQIKKSMLIVFLIVAACVLVAVYQGKKAVPSDTEWYNKVWEIMIMHRLIAIVET